MIWNLVISAAVAASTFSTAKALQTPAFDFGFALPQNSASAQAPAPTPSPASGDIIVQGSVGQTGVASQGVTSSGFGSAPAFGDTELLQGNAVAPQISRTYIRANSAERKQVSISFHAAHAGDVFAWLDRQGVSYAISDDSLKSKSISMNIVNKPLYEVIDALASALGGHWSRQGEIRVFKTGADAFTFEPAWNNQSAIGTFRTAPYTVRSLQNSLGSIQTPSNFSGTMLYGRGDLKGLLMSLTPDQKKLQETQGYLLISDLTPSQLAMYPFKSQGTFKLEVEIDGQKLVVKNH